MEQNNQNKKIDNSALISAIAEMRENYSNETQNKVINTSLRCTFLVPAIVENKQELIADENNNLTFNEQPKARFILINHKTNGSFFPVFTSEEELKKLKTKEKFSAFQMTFADIAGLTENTPDISGFVINPFNQNLPYTKEMLANIKEVLIKSVENKKNADSENNDDDK